MSKVILISGASSGLGKTLGLQLHQLGNTVFGTSRNPQKYDLPFQMVMMDLERPETIKAAVQTIINEAGRIDILINNAGIGIAGPLEHQRLESIEKVWRTNVSGTLLLSKEVVPFMREQGGGKLLNISSLAGVLGLPYRSCYSASKAAVDLLSDSWRMELQPFKVQSTSIWCGDMQTPIGDRRLQDFNREDPVYQASYERVYHAIDEDVASGLSVEEAAGRVVQIVEKQKLRRRYVVAKPLQKAAILAKRLLPDATFDLIINRFSKL